MAQQTAVQKINGGSCSKNRNNFVLSCAIEAIGEAESLVRKLGVEPQMFQDVLTQCQHNA